MYFSILFSYKKFSSRMIMVRYGERGEEEGGRGWSAVRCDGREEAVGGLGEGRVW